MDEKQDEMDKLLKDCIKLTEWSKKSINKRWKGMENIKGEVALGLSGRYEDRKIDDGMIPEVVKCLNLLGDKAKFTNLQGNQITSSGATVLFKGLKELNSKIKMLNLAGNPIDDDCMKSLGEFIKENSYIEDVKINQSRITDAGIETLAAYLDGNTSLKRLDISKIEVFTGKSVPTLVKMLESSHIIDLIARDTSLADSKPILIAMVHNIIRYGGDLIELEQKEIDDEDIIKICEYMKKYGCGKLEGMDLNENNLTSKGASQLFNTLKQCNTKLEYMYLNNCKNIDDEALPSIIACLESCAIHVLSIQETSITKKDTLAPYLFVNIIKSGSISVEFMYKEIQDEALIKICDAIKKYGCGKIRSMQFGSNKITSKGASVLFETLRECNSTITTLTLSNNNLSDGCMEQLGRFIQESKDIESLLIQETDISDEDIRILSTFLKGNKTLKLISIERNTRITDKSVPILTSMIESSCIQVINVDGTSISNDSIFILPIAFNTLKNKSDMLIIDEKNVTDDDILKICKIMKTFGIESLKEIEMLGNNITSKGASELFNTLKECHSVIERINLMENHIDDECMILLGEYIRDNEYLEMLEMEGNQITDKGVKILPEYLFGNITMKHLLLSDNEGITDESVPYLLQIAKRSGLKVIDVESTSISANGIAIIKKTLATTIDERELPINSKSKSAAKISC